MGAENPIVPPARAARAERARPVAPPPAPTPEPAPRKPPLGRPGERWMTWEEWAIAFVVVAAIANAAARIYAMVTAR